MSKLVLTNKKEFKKGFLVLFYPRASSLFKELEISGKPIERSLRDLVYKLKKKKKKLRLIVENSEAMDKNFVYVLTKLIRENLIEELILITNDIKAFFKSKLRYNFIRNNNFVIRINGREFRLDEEIDLSLFNFSILFGVLAIFNPYYTIPHLFFLLVFYMMLLKRL